MKSGERPRFIQIMRGKKGDAHLLMYALDDAGSVWELRYNSGGFKWQQLNYPFP